MMTWNEDKSISDAESTHATITTQGIYAHLVNVNRSFEKKC